jgi:protein ImuA
VWKRLGVKTHFDTATLDPLTLVAARVHEAQGRARRAFALFQAARSPGTLVWIIPTHLPELPFLGALPSGVNERLHLFRPTTETDLLWTVEEALRAPGVGLVIAEPQRPLSLTAGRRLQLAAEAGQTRGLMLIHTDAGSNAAESRWQCDAIPGAGRDSTLQRWSLIKNKKGTIGSWVLNWNGTSSAFNLVSEARE